MDSKIVTAVHPDSQVRILLRCVLQDRARTVLTDHSWRDLLADGGAPQPSVLLIDRSFIGEHGMDVLHLLHERWPDSEILILPEALEVEERRRDAMVQLLRHVDRLLAMKTSRELQIQPV